MASDKEAKLREINAYVNTFKYIHPSDHTPWLLPEQFVSQGGGDCKDFAAYKYFIIKEAGISNNLRLLIVWDRALSAARGQTITHEILIVDDYYVLDSQSKSELFTIHSPYLTRYTPLYFIKGT